MDRYEDDESRGGAGFDPMALVRVFLRRKRLFIIPFFLCLGMAAVAIKTQAPIYFSTAQVNAIQQATTTRSLPSESRGYGYDVDRETFGMLQTIVTSPKFLARVVDEMQLVPRAVEAGVFGPRPVTVTPEDWERHIADRLAAQLKNQIRVRQDGMHLFSLGVRDHSPEQSYLLTRRILQDFLDEERADRLQPSSSTREFLEGQRKIFREQLAAAQSRLNDFQSGILKESLAGNPVTKDNLSAAEALLASLHGQVFDASGPELRELERQTRAVTSEPPTFETWNRQPEVAGSVRQLVALEYAQAVSDLARQAAGEQSSAAIGAARLDLSRLLESKTAREYPKLTASERNRVAQYAYAIFDEEIGQQVMTRLAKDIQDYRDFVARQPSQAATLSSLQQEVTRVQDLLGRIEGDISQEDLRLAANLSEIGYKIVVRQDPSRPEAPIEPDVMRLNLMGFALALGIGAGLVLLVEFLDRSLKTVPDIERVLRVKVIGTLPMTENSLFEARRARRPWLWAGMIFGVLVLAAGFLLLLYPRLS